MFCLTRKMQFVEYGGGDVGSENLMAAPSWAAADQIEPASS
jgi:hypothetical protein